MKLIAHNVISGFSGAEHSSLKIDLLFAGHIPQEELKANVIRAINSRAALVALLDHAENAVYWGLKQHAADVEEGVCTAKAVPGYIVGLRDAAKQARQALADAKGGK